MSLFPFRRKQQTKNDELSLEQLLADIQAGDEQARDAFIRKYIPFVAKVASQSSKRFIRQGEDDEFSIALSAFNEAINRYDQSKGANFLSFAETVIKRRLIDYFRSKSSRNRDIPLTEFEIEDDEKNVINVVEVQKSIDEHTRQKEQMDRAEEILRYTEVLASFDIHFEELVELSPKHSDARQSAIEVARVISADPLLMKHLHEKKSLPLKQLLEHVKVSRKTIERQRKYIIAIALILSGDFELLQGYIR
ncbi:RNA polymerase sigma factor SigI [Fodinisporobacter ferrooxydans]|uniref:RNA polymerase sigma factor SigI n=1 Tax=Fodinisporobacter ferrooxydans TaxID=2901836 RepID=A0ABY4CXV5_9BACL|nr:RNA polymerase sigma factor SigI [Alicyclobacillaceae bacterium MYW30-H2]